MDTRTLRLARNPANAWLFTDEERAAARRTARQQRIERRDRADPTFAPASLVTAFTSRERPSAQARVLDAIGIAYQRRPDGSLIVLRCLIESVPPVRRGIVRREPRLVL